MREVQLRLGRTPKAGEYMIERDEIFRETAAEGRPRSIPSMATIYRRYSCWNDALVAAGLVEECAAYVDHHRVYAATRRMEPEHVLTALGEAYDTLGDPFTQRRYEEWRKLEICRKPSRAYELPSYGVAYLRWGGWVAATREMQRRRNG